MMSRIDSTPRGCHPQCVTVRHFDGYEWSNGVWQEEKTILHTGFSDFRVMGVRRGDDLTVFFGGHDMTHLLDPDVTDHATAVAWCRTQLGDTEHHA